MTHRTTRAVARELSDLTEAARSLTTQAEAEGMRSTAAQVRAIAYNLDAARTRLIQDPDYIAVAESFVTAASEYLPAHAAHIGRSRRLVQA